MILAAALAVSAHGGYIVSISSANPSAPTLTVLNEQLEVLGAVSMPGAVQQVLLADDGTRLIVLTQNAAAPLSVVNVTAGGVGQPRVITLPSGAGTPTRMTLSPDGARLIVATAGPSRLYFVQMSNEQALPDIVPLPSTAVDMEFTRDSAYLVVLSDSNILQPVRVADWLPMAPVAVPGSYPSGSLRLSVAPFGSLYITGLNLLLELAGTPPFGELARTSPLLPTLTHPGKLYFTPTGTRAFTPGRLQGGHSIGLVDFTLRGSNSPAGSLVATGVAVSTVGGPFGTTPQLLDPVLLVREDRALALAPSIPQVFDITRGVGGGLNVTDVRVGQQILTGITGIASSGEIPNALRFFYVDSTGKHSMLPLAGLGNVMQRDLQPGRLEYVFAPSGSNPGNLLAYGDGKTVAPGTTLRYYVRAFDLNGRPVKGATVTFRAVTGNPGIQSPTSVTNREGFAYVDVTAPAEAGAFTIEALAGNVAPVAMTSTVQGQTGGGSGGGGDGGGAPTGPRLKKISGDGQLAMVGVINEDLVVRAVDADGNPIPNKDILWQTASAGVNFITENPTRTDANGEARMRMYVVGLTDPSLPYYQVEVEAVADFGRTVFYATQYPNDQFGRPLITLQTPSSAERTITLKLGKPEAGKLKIMVQSGIGLGRPANVPIPNVSLKLTSRNTDPAAGPVVGCVEENPLSTVDGVATCTLLAKGRIGTTFFNALIGNESMIDDIRVIVEPGEPVPPKILSGNNQNGKVGEALPLPLVAQIVDAGGNPLPGTQVTWVVSNPSALQLVNTVSTAGPDGKVSTRVQLGVIPGQYTVTVRMGQLEAVFQVTVESVVSTLRKVSGDGQPVVPVGAAFPQPLVVEVLDVLNRPVQGISVNWTVAGAATVSAAVTVTDANGRAQVTVTAGATAGPITVTAAAVDLTPVSFSLQSRLPGPDITAQSFRNYATNQTGVAPGNLVILSGSGIARNVTGAAVANLLVGRLPIEFKGLVVEFRSGGKSHYAPIYWIVKEGDLEEALVQVPYEITGTSVDVNVSVDGIATLVTGVPVTPLSPGMIEDRIDGRRAAIVIRSDGLVATRATPARRGETVRLYAIGLGQTEPVAETNRVGRPDQKVTATVAVGIDNAGVEVVGAKLAENLIGIYEVLFKIPEDAQVGDRPLGLVAAQQGGPPFYAQGSVIPVGPREE
ncbi:MAG: Ig-like domain-containing protein [Bryobacteraceae bacterium]